MPCPWWSAFVSQSLGRASSSRVSSSGNRHRAPQPPLSPPAPHIPYVAACHRAPMMLLQTNLHHAVARQAVILRHPSRHTVHLLHGHTLLHLARDYLPRVCQSPCASPSSPAASAVSGPPPHRRPDTAALQADGPSQLRTRHLSLPCHSLANSGNYFLPSANQHALACIRTIFVDASSSPHAALSSLQAPT